MKKKKNGYARVKVSSVSLTDKAKCMNSILSSDFESGVENTVVV